MSSYVVYEIESTRYAITKYGSPVRFKNTGAAKAAITRLVKSGEYKAGEIGFAESSVFSDTIEKKVERVNLMTKKTFVEPINTPIYCSPAYESYWSM